MGCRLVLSHPPPNGRLKGENLEGAGENFRCAKVFQTFVCTFHLVGELPGDKTSGYRMAHVAWKTPS